MAPLVREVGNWVKGERFWDREQEIWDLQEHLDEGAHILLVAPRRVGKTSLMRELADRIDARYVCLYLDLERSQTPEDAMVELSLATRPHQTLWGKTRDVFRNALANVDALSSDELVIKLREGFGADWQARGDRLLADLATSDRPVVIFMDELPILVNRLLKGSDFTVTPERLRQTDAFVSFLRAQSIKHRSKIRFVLAGSIGLEPILRQANLSAAINTFTPFELHPWDAETAVGCLDALAENYGVRFAQGATRQIVTLLGACVPHHVQMFFNHVYVDCKRRGDMDCGVPDVDRVYQSSMLSNRGHAELSHLEERLKMVVGQRDLPLALDLLTEAAVTGRLTVEAANALAREEAERRSQAEGAPSAGAGELQSRELLRELLAVFEHDGYLHQEEEGYVFASRLVRDWWKARFKFGFTPALSRRSPE